MQKMSLNKRLPKLTKKLKVKKIHPNEIIKNRMEEEGKYHKAISEMIANPHHLHLEYITIYKPKFRPIKGIYDKQKLLLAHELNAFRKTFYSFEQKNIQNKKIYSKFEDKSKENNFLEKYKLFKNRADNKYFNDKELLKELREDIEKNNIKVPDLDLNKNLFDNNLLLVKEENINKFLSYNFGTQKGDNKAYNYISKINKILSKNKKSGQGVFNLFDDEQEVKNNNSLFNDYSFKNGQILRDKKEMSLIDESENVKNINVNETLKNLKEIDEFINSDNKEYSEQFDNEISEQNFKIKNQKKDFKTDFHKTFFNLPKTTMNKSFYSIKEEGREKIFDKKRLNKSLTLVNKNMNIYRKNDITKKFSSFYNKKDDEIFNHDKGIIKHNKSDYNSMDKADLIKLKKIYLNRKSSQKSLNTIDSRTSTIYPSTTYGKFFPKRKLDTKPKTLKFISKSKSILSSKSTDEAEKVYEKIRNTDDSSKYNDMIKKYLKNKYSSQKIFDFSVFDIFNNYYYMQKNINKQDFIGKNIRLKRASKMDLESIDKLKHFSSTTNFGINKIKNKMERMMNKISFPNEEE